MASRQKAKEEARAKRLAAEQAEAEAAARRQRMFVTGGVVLLAVAAAAVVIAIAAGGGGSSGIPKTKAAKTAVTNTVSTLLAGIPQSGTTLGNPSAPVTMTYFGDLECPVCAAFTTGADGGGLSQFVGNQVKAGKVKVVYRSFCTATCNDEGQSVFNDQQAAAYSAGVQHKFWNYAETFYREQGAEGSGYVTESFLDKLAEQVPGLSYTAWQADRKDPSVTEQVQSDQQLASQKSLSGTPTVIFTGPKGSVEAPQGIPSYSQLEQEYSQVA